MATISVSVHTLDDLAAPTPELELMLETARDMARPAAQTQSTTRLDIRTLPVSTSAGFRRRGRLGRPDLGALSRKPRSPSSDKAGPGWPGSTCIRSFASCASLSAAPAACLFLVVPVSVIVRHDALLGPHPSDFRSSLISPPAASGSRSRQLASGAPADGFTGLRMQRRNHPAERSGPARAGAALVVVPPSVTVTLSLTLDPPSAATGSGPGADASEATAGLPATVRFVLTGSRLRLDHADPARMVAYGCEVSLNVTGAAPSFVSAFNLDRLCGHAGRSHLFGRRCGLHVTFVPAGSAPIQSGAWTVPGRDSRSLASGQASGAGALAVNLAPGLKATWLGQGASGRTRRLRHQCRHAGLWRSARSRPKATACGSIRSWEIPRQPTGSPSPGGSRSPRLREVVGSGR